MHFSPRSIRNLLLSPFLLALPVAVAIFLLIPDRFPEYRATLDQSGFTEKPGGLEYFADLDRDGVSERIVYFNNTLKQASLKLVTANGSIISHCYMHGEMIAQHEVLSIFEDEQEEPVIFVYTRSADSLFLNVVKPGKSDELTALRCYVATLGKSKGIYDFGLQPAFYEDLDNDGHKEFLGGVMSGFPLHPRLFFIYDLHRDTLIFSPPTGIYYFITGLADLDGDGKKELLTTTYSIDNFPDSVTGMQGDHSAWLMVLDHRLQYFFEPVEFKGRYVHVQTAVFRQAGAVNLLSLVYQSVEDNFKPFLVLSDIHGNRIRDRILEEPDQPGSYRLLEFPGDDHPLCLQKPSGNIAIPGIDLSFSDDLYDNTLNVSYLQSFDADHDGKTEHLFMRADMQVPVILRDDLSEPVTLEFPANKEMYRISQVKKGDRPPQIFIQQGERYYLFTYGFNPNYYLKYPFLVAIYLAILTIVLGSQYIQRRLLKQRYDAEKQIAGLQLMLLKNQMDPHFTYNAINAVTSLLMQSRNEEANQKLVSLSKLMRSGVEHAGRLARPLGEELSFVNNYVDLVRHRLNEDFRYTITVAPEVDLSWQVPRMVTQIYVENSIKHGLIPLETDGKLDLRVFTDKRSIVIEIEDNGIGRQRAAINGTGGTGKGMAVMEQFYALFNRFNKEKITCTITDLYHDDRQPAGTLVRITIPQDFRYSFYGKPQEKREGMIG